MYGGYYTGIIPEADIEIGLPFAWETPEEISDALYNWGLYDEFVKIYAEHNIWPAIFANSCLYQVGSTSLVSKPEDLKGKKIRALGIYGNFVNSFGGSAVNIPKGELYMALKLGTVDGALYSAEGAMRDKLNEVTKYVVSSPNTCPLGNTWLFNMDSIKKLPDDIRNIFYLSVPHLIDTLAIYLPMMDEYQLMRGIANGNWIERKWSAEDSAAATLTSLTILDNVIAKKSPGCKTLVDQVKAQLKELGKLK